MSKASKSSLQYLLRQLALARSATGTGSSNGPVLSSSSSSSIETATCGNSSRNSVNALPSAAFSTGARAAHGGHHLSGTVTPPESHAAISSSSAASTPASTDWNGQLGGHHHRRVDAVGRSNKASSHYQHLNGNHQQRQVPSAASSLLPSFWIQPNASSTTSSSSGASSGIPPVPPISFTSNPNASSPSSSSSSTSDSVYAHAPASSASTSSTSLSSTHILGATSYLTSSEASPHHYSATINPSSAAGPSRFLDQLDGSAHENQINQSGLTLLPGAYGIPKRSGGRLGGSSKGKERELDLNDPVQAQMNQMQQSLLSVQVGEDAYFVRHDALGVADGVGGWSGRKGADPGFFAARLMHHCSAELALAEQLAVEGSSSSSPGSTVDGMKSKKPHLAFVSSASATAHGDQVVENVLDPEAAGTTTSRTTKQSSNPADTTGKNSNMPTPPSISHSYSGTDPAEDGETGEDLHHVLRAGDPIEILHRAWDLTLTEFFDFELIGSSTALIALLKDDELRLANIGDCCCSIIRGSDYIFRSQEQQHSFNYPFQMGTNSKDTPRKDGQKFNIKVQKNDVVILSSDGLVDNLFDEDILEEVLRQQDDASEPTTSAKSGLGDCSDTSNSANMRRAPPLSAEKLSKALCSRAKAVSEDQRAVSSPFQQRANEEGIHFVGGKHDDITVLVAIIGDKQETSTSASASA